MDHQPASPAPHHADDDVLTARGVRKSFNGIEVLHGVDFSLRRGEIHGIVGQNGAGKSTLVKIISGAYAADEGTVTVASHAGLAAVPGSADVAMVFQEFSLIPSMSVAHNILLGREPKWMLGLIDEREAERRSRDSLALLGAEIDVRALVEDLPVGSRQLVEIAKALSQNARILILDEPTAPLTAVEIDGLMRAIRTLTSHGISIIYISHHLEEVMAACDRITILRDGQVDRTVRTAETSLPDVIEGMLGRSLESALEWQARQSPPGEPVLSAVGLATARLHDVSFSIRRGEIVGVAGLLGSGRSEIARALFGVDRLDGGQISINGRAVRIRSPGEAIAAGVALVPEDRGRAGLVATHSVRDNLMMAAWNRFSRIGLIQDRRASHVARQLVEQLSIRVGRMGQEVRGLSGGNQQKVVIGKNLTVDPIVLLLDDPTVGIDIGSKREILTEIRTLARQGTAVLLISSELEELSGLADRVLVLDDGAIRMVLDRAAGDDLSADALSRAVQGAAAVSSGHHGGSAGPTA